MTVADENVREFVHERFRAADAKLDRALSDLQTITRRLASLESRFTSLDHSIAHIHERIDVSQQQLDGIVRSLGRIERRLDLADEGGSTA
jgi:chromosome segregation ATPase